MHHLKFKRIERPAGIKIGTRVSVTTTMSSLSAEVLDHVVDFLHDSTKVLKSCYLVSKSWVPCSRRHIFASVAFRTPIDLEIWKETFQDSSTSSAFYTKALHVGCPDVVTAEDAEEGGWVRTFCRVVWFEVEVSETDSGEWAVSFFTVPWVLARSQVPRRYFPSPFSIKYPQPRLFVSPP